LEYQLKQEDNENELPADISPTERNILLVDDDTTLLESLADSLALLNKSFKVTTATSAEEAAEYFQMNPIDLLITDLILPGISGLELAEQLHSFNPRVKSIMISGYGNEQILASAKRYGCLAQLNKPFALTELVSLINSAFDNRGKFRVSLPELTLPDLLHLYKRNKENVVLSIVSDQASGILVIEAGSISHVRYNGQEGPAALLDIVDIKAGSINALSSSAAPNKSTVSISAEALEAAVDSANPALILGIAQNSKEEVSSENVEKENTRLSEMISSEMLAECSDSLIENLEELLTEGGFLPEEEALGEKADSQSQAEAKLEDFSEEDLILHPEPEELVLHYSPRMQRRRAVARELVNKGVEHFKAQQLGPAKEAWEQALVLDRKNKDATRNLEILEQLIESIKK
jgi:FixJ family two-component response regulator